MTDAAERDAGDRRRRPEPRRRPPGAAERLVWIDLEMTGLDTERHTIVEIAVLITDGALELVDDGIDLVIHATPGGARPHGRLRAEHAHEVGPAPPDRGVDALARGRRRRGARVPRARACPRTPHRSAATRSASTGGSSTATCPRSTGTCTTAASTSARSRSCAGAGTRPSTRAGPASPRPTGRSTTSASRSRSCATTATTSSSCPGRRRRDRRGNRARESRHHRQVVAEHGPALPVVGHRRVEHLGRVADEQVVEPLGRRRRARPGRPVGRRAAARRPRRRRASASLQPAVANTPSSARRGLGVQVAGDESAPGAWSSSGTRLARPLRRGRRRRRGARRRRARSARRRAASRAARSRRRQFHELPPVREHLRAGRRHGMHGPGSRDPRPGTRTGQCLNRQRASIIDNATRSAPSCRRWISWSSTTSGPSAASAAAASRDVDPVTPLRVPRDDGEPCLPAHQPSPARPPAAYGARRAATLRRRGRP